MSNRRVRSISPARRVISTSRPSHTASNSARVIMVGRGDSGDCTKALSSPTLARSKNPPSRSVTIPGKGALASRSQLVTRDRALRPSSLAQRSISAMPIGLPPKRWRIWSGSAPRPWKPSSITRAASPGSVGLAPSDSVLNSQLQSSRRYACGCVNNCCWLGGGSVISVPPWPSLAMTKLDAMYWPSSATLWACRPSLTVRLPPVLSLFAE